jgi:large conductance mechanosensitive channel
MSFKSDFKEFISKGNVIDLAVGVVIGAAFGKIVSSLVDDILMPPVGMMVGGVNFTELKIVLKSATMDAAGKTIDPVTINYGNFIQVAINFIIIALAVFVFVVKPVNALKRKEVAAPAPAAGPTKDQILLSEIRDLLRK